MCSLHKLAYWGRNYHLKVRGASTNLNSWPGLLICSAVFAFQTVAVRSVLTGVVEGESIALRLFDEDHRHLIASDLCSDCFDH